MMLCLLLSKAYPALSYLLILLNIDIHQQNLKHDEIATTDKEENEIQTCAILFAKILTSFKYLLFTCIKIRRAH